MSAQPSELAKSIKPSPTLGMTALANELKAKGVDVISLAAGEPDFNTPAVICEAAKAALDQGLTKYAPSRGLPVFRKEIVKKLTEENGIPAEEDMITVTAGAKQALMNALLATVDQGDEVILLAPYWGSYAAQVKLAGGVPVIVQSTFESGFQPDPEAIAAAITPKTKAIMVNSPCNPTGAGVEIDRLKAIAELALKHSLWVISDEIYESLVYGDFKPVSIASLSDEIAAQTITINGCSKTFAMTGWRIGYACAPAAITKAMASVQDQTTSGAVTFGQAAAVEALKMPAEEIEKVRAEFEARRNQMLADLRKIKGLRVNDPQGAFYLFPDVSALMEGRFKTDIELSEYLLEKAHVAVVPGSAFAAPGHIRISTAVSREDLAEAAKRLAQALTAVPA
jgi:aspartate aminotransferase